MVQPAVSADSVPVGYGTLVPRRHPSGDSRFAPGGHGGGVRQARVAPESRPGEGRVGQPGRTCVKANRGPRIRSARADPRRRVRSAMKPRLPATATENEWGPASRGLDGPDLQTIGCCKSRFTPVYTSGQLNRNVMSSSRAVTVGSVVVRMTRYWRYRAFGLPTDPPFVAAAHADQVPSGVAVEPLRVWTTRVVFAGRTAFQLALSQVATAPASKTADVNVPLAGKSST